MMGSPGILRRTYDYVALFALLHMIALFSLLAYLGLSGTIDRAKLQGAAKALRGEAVESVVLASSPVTAHPVAPEEPKPMPESPAEVRQELEVLRLEAERVRTELDQRLTLNNNILLRVTTQREAFQKEQKAASEREAASEASRREEGFQKQVAIFESLSPKVAVEHLLNNADPDEAARILLEMETRKAKKIVEAAKRGDQMDRMRVILQRLRDVAPDRSAEIESEQEAK